MRVAQPGPIVLLLSSQFLFLSSTISASHPLEADFEAFQDKLRSDHSLLRRWTLQIAASLEQFPPSASTPYTECDSDKHCPAIDSDHGKIYQICLRAAAAASFAECSGGGDDRGCCVGGPAAWSVAAGGPLSTSEPTIGTELEVTGGALRSENPGAVEIMRRRRASKAASDLVPRAGNWLIQHRWQKKKGGHERELVVDVQEKKPRKPNAPSGYTDPSGLIKPVVESELKDPKKPDTPTPPSPAPAVVKKVAVVVQPGKGEVDEEEPPQQQQPAEEQVHPNEQQQVEKPAGQQQQQQRKQQQQAVRQQQWKDPKKPSFFGGAVAKPELPAKLPAPEAPAPEEPEATKVGTTAAKAPEKKEWSPQPPSLHLQNNPDLLALPESNEDIFAGTTDPSISGNHKPTHASDPSLYKDPIVGEAPEPPPPVDEPPPPGPPPESSLPKEKSELEEKAEDLSSGLDSKIKSLKTKLKEFSNNNNKKDPSLAEFHKEKFKQKESGQPPTTPEAKESPAPASPSPSPSASPSPSPSPEVPFTETFLNDYMTGKYDMLASPEPEPEEGEPSASPEPAIDLNDVDDPEQQDDEQQAPEDQDDGGVGAAEVLAPKEKKQKPSPTPAPTPEPKADPITRDQLEGPNLSSKQAMYKADMGAQAAAQKAKMKAQKEDKKYRYEAPGLANKEQRQSWFQTECEDIPAKIVATNICTDDGRCSVINCNDVKPQFSSPWGWSSKCRNLSPETFEASTPLQKAYKTFCPKACKVCGPDLDKRVKWYKEACTDIKGELVTDVCDEQKRCNLLDCSYLPEPDKKNTWHIPSECSDGKMGKWWRKFCPTKCKICDDKLATARADVEGLAKRLVKQCNAGAAIISEGNVNQDAMRQSSVTWFEYLEQHFGAPCILYMYTKNAQKEHEARDPTSGLVVGQSTAEGVVKLKTICEEGSLPGLTCWDNHVYGPSALTYLAQRLRMEQEAQGQRIQRLVMAYEDHGGFTSITDPDGKVVEQKPTLFYPQDTLTRIPFLRALNNLCGASDQTVVYVGACHSAALFADLSKIRTPEGHRTYDSVIPENCMAEGKHFMAFAGGIPSLSISSSKYGVEDWAESKLDGNFQAFQDEVFQNLHDAVTGKVTGKNGCYTFAEHASAVVDGVTLGYCPTEEADALKYLRTYQGFKEHVPMIVEGCSTPLKYTVPFLKGIPGGYKVESNEMTAKQASPIAFGTKAMQSACLTDFFKIPKGKTSWQYPKTSKFYPHVNKCSCGMVNGAISKDAPRKFRARNVGYRPKGDGVCCKPCEKEPSCGLNLNIADVSSLSLEKAEAYEEVADQDPYDDEEV